MISLMLAEPSTESAGNARTPARTSGSDATGADPDLEAESAFRDFGKERRHKQRHERLRKCTRAVVVIGGAVE